MAKKTKTKKEGIRMKPLIPVYIHARLISNDKSYDGIIGNVSEYGAYVEIEGAKTALPFMPGTKVELKFQAFSKQTIKLPCEVIWLYTKKNSPNNLINSLGLEIINPSAKYEKFFKTL